MTGCFKSAALAMLAMTASILATQRAMADANDASVVPWIELEILQAQTWNLRHQSLEGAPDVPAPGFSIGLECKIDEGTLTKCRAETPLADAYKAFLPAALKRAQAYRIGPLSTSGLPLSGRKTVVPIAFSTADRFPGSTINFSKGDLIAYARKPTPDEIMRYYPNRALDHEVEAVIDLACSVNETLSLTCDDVRVLTMPESFELPDLAETMRVEFREAARKIMARYVVSPKLSTGETSVGAGVRHPTLLR